MNPDHFRIRIPNSAEHHTATALSAWQRAGFPRKEWSSMYYEEMARLRHQQLRSEAESQRLARRLAAGRFWHRVASYARHRAERVDREWQWSP